MSARLDAVAFGVIIDDIVYPDGSTVMGVLGGGGPQTAFGMRLWQKRVGLAAGVGGDFSGQVTAWLVESGIDSSGLRLSDLPTPRAWQLLEHDERRTQVWRVSPQVLATHLKRSTDLLSEAYKHARGFHFGIHPEEPALEFVGELNRLGAVVSVELFRPAYRVPNPGELRDLLRGVDVFSANLQEALSLTGSGDPQAISEQLIEAGARIVALRLGADGSLISDRDQDMMIRVPAVSVQVANPIGAGNAYCGGFLAGWLGSQDLVTAGVYGAVAASFLVENETIPTVSQSIIRQAHQRADKLFSLVSKIDKGA